MRNTVGRKYRFVVHEKDINERVDLFLEKHLTLQKVDVSRSFIQNYIDNVLVNTKKKKKNYRVKKEDIIHFVFPENPVSELIPEEIDFEIIFEDSHLMIVNKPAGLVVHPAKGHYTGTLVHGLLNKLTDFDDNSFGFQQNQFPRPGIVHRLDKDTSGLLVVAKNISIQRKLMNLFQNRKVKKKYVALVKGKIPSEGKIDYGIGRHPVYRKKFRESSCGKKALTYFKRLNTYHIFVGHSQDYSLVEIHPITGRTHQIRVHLSAISHPVVGDSIYSKQKSDFEKQGMALCSKELSFIHPATNNMITFEIELPSYFQKMIDQITAPDNIHN